MRIFGLVFATGLLLVSSSLVAQHSSTTSTASSPAAAPAPAPTPAPAPAAAPAPAPAPAAAASSSHNSTPSSPAPASTPFSHSASAPSPASGSSASHASSSFAEASATRAATPPRSSTGDESRIVNPRRGGEVSSSEVTSKKENSTAPESDLHRRICPDGDCKDPKPEPAEGDLRRRVCPNGKCEECPAGKSMGKNGGCVAAPAVANTVSTCQPNEAWNGIACAPISMNRCQAGETWNGAECVNPTLCSSFSGRADMLAAEARSIRSEMETACSLNSQSQDCIRLTQNHDGAVQRYRMLLNEAPVNCRTTLPDAITL